MVHGFMEIYLGAASSQLVSHFEILFYRLLTFAKAGITELYGFFMGTTAFH